MREKRNAYRVFVSNLKDTDHLADLGISGRIVFIWTLKNRMGGHGLDLSDSGKG
jgi:hypothetical protein